MKSALLVSTGALFIAALTACSPAADPPTVTRTGGNSGTGGSTTPGTGGSVISTGGSGSDATGGSVVSTGGSQGSTGGSSSSTGGSSTSTGGTTGTGGGSTSTGGSSPGNTGGAGGRGTGGAAVSTGGANGSGGAGGGPVGPLLGIVGALDGYLFTAPCGDGGTGFDCLNSGCTANAKTTMMNFPIGGTMGVIYNVTFNVRGVVEAKNYSGSTRRAGTAMTYADNADFWSEGGTVPMSSYNSYEMHVTPRVTGAPNDYYLNARNGTGENHESWKLGYTATIKVPGGGSVQWRVFDSNCRQIMNCGPGAGSSATGCRAPGTVSLAGLTPQPASFMQPYVGGAANNATGQWVYIDVTSVTVAP